MWNKIKNFWKQKTLKDIFSSKNISSVLSGLIFLLPFVAPFLKRFTLMMLLPLITILYVINQIYCDREYQKLKKIEKEYYGLNKKYNSLSQLKEVLFQHFSVIIYDQIDKKREKDMRVTMYCYDKRQNNFYLLSRYSLKEAYNDRHSDKRYPNKGWLNIIWNEGEYVFSFDGKDERWVDKCIIENKKYCKQNCRCKGNRKKCDYQNKLCPSLTDVDLKCKNMKARFSYGVILKNNTKKLGIILVEDMSIRDALEEQKIKDCVATMINSSQEILTQFGEDIIQESKLEKDIVNDCSKEINNG